MNPMFYRVTTNKTVDEAVEAVGRALKDNQFSVLWDLDINQKLEEKGIEPEPPYHILEVCSAPRAKKALSTNPVVGNFLPCKIVVYQDRESGATAISLPMPRALIGLLEDPDLESLAEEVSELMKAAVDQAARA